MGQEISVTALQLAMAYSAIANGGYLLRPKIVQQIMGDDGKIMKNNNSKVLRRVASLKTMETLKNILVKKGYKFYTETDTEILINFIELCIEECIELCIVDCIVSRFA